jgi:hypothetical protein
MLTKRPDETESVVLESPLPHHSARHGGCVWIRTDIDPRIVTVASLLFEVRLGRNIAGKGKLFRNSGVIPEFGTYSRINSFSGISL